MVAAAADDTIVVSPLSGCRDDADAVDAPPPTSLGKRTTSAARLVSSDSIVALPAGLICTLAGEGSANAVFRMHSPAAVATAATTADTALLSSHLLRLPKTVPGVHPHVCLDHHAYYVSVLQPLLGVDSLVGQRLVRGVASLQPQLNRLLAAQDQDPLHQRRPDWRGMRVADGVDVALLVEDMNRTPAASTSAKSAGPVVTIEFKPKWLAQSPTAPPGARRCRTCALSASLASRGPAVSGRKPKPCPLVLLAEKAVTHGIHGTHGTRTNGTSSVAGAGRRDDLDDALWNYICHHLPPDDLLSTLATASSSQQPLLMQLQSPPVRAAIVHWLRTTDLFRRVAAIQREYDPVGALHVRSADDGTDDEILDRLQTAMTLRDCTCYLRVSLDADGRLRDISAKLGDLDRKVGQHRLARWQAQERALIEGGFYTATEEPRQTTMCWLGR